MPSVFIEPQVYRPYVEAVRQSTLGLPVLSVLGRLTSVAEGEAALEAGACDMVGAARALIAEPELVKNAYEGNEDQAGLHRLQSCASAPSHGAAGARSIRKPPRAVLGCRTSPRPAGRPRSSCRGRAGRGSEAARVSARGGTTLPPRGPGGAWRWSGLWASFAGAVYAEGD